jgi:hypothetical protein
MKTLEFIIIYLLISCSVPKTAAVSQNNKIHTPGYKTLYNFKNDTLQYLKFNLIERKNTYVGEELDVLLNDLEVPVKSYMYSPGSDLKVHSIVLMLDDYNTSLKKKYDNKKPIVLIVSFDTPVDIDEMNAMKSNNSFDWTSKQEGFYGKMIVKDTNVKQMKK